MAVLSKKIALISGISGQDGSYLAELLLSKDYDVHGMVRPNSYGSYKNIGHLIDDITLHNGDLCDSASIFGLVNQIQPDEIYNLGAQSHVGVSFENPVYTADVNAIGALRFLEAIRLSGLSKQTKFYQASTSELYGDVAESPQSEDTPFRPQSPYAIAKLFAYWAVRNYRASYGLFACNGILFNHESPRRGVDFVTQKIVKGLCKIKKGSDEPLLLGNLDALRDWGHARDYVEMQWMMLQQDVADDFVVATGIQQSVRDFVNLVARQLDLTIAWHGAGLDEKAVLPDGTVIVQVNPLFFRPAEVDALIGNIAKAKSFLGWQPKTDLDALVREMIACEMDVV